jgi:hypothetical protein
MTKALSATAMLIGRRAEAAVIVTAIATPPAGPATVVIIAMLLGGPATVTAIATRLAGPARVAEIAVLFVSPRMVMLRVAKRLGACLRRGQPGRHLGLN